VIYLDTSVALAHLLAEDRRPPRELWDQVLVSSRLLEYELWARIHGRGLTDSHSEAARALLGRLAFLELVTDVLARARNAFPAPLRTLDGLHLASMVFLRDQGQEVALASYDERLTAAARLLSFDAFPLP
jgi:predicted nucleic acid-binding protein